MIGDMLIPNDTMNWFIDSDGAWIRCKIESRLFSIATILLYTGETLTGSARRGVYGWIVEATR